jgi:hypothetical protein
VHNNGRDVWQLECATCDARGKQRPEPNLSRNRWIKFAFDLPANALQAALFLLSAATTAAAVLVTPAMAGPEHRLQFRPYDRAGLGEAVTATPNKIQFNGVGE